MFVYVINIHGEPLMPCKPRKARLLLKQGKAKVIKKEPFTIQLLFGSSGYKQDITLGVDTGSKIIGLSASTEQQELITAEVHLRNDISDLLTNRRQLRRTRRSRLRYRKARWKNRISSKKKGWLAPSIKHKIQTHINIIGKIHEILPITNIIVETASFNIQKLKESTINKDSQRQDGRLNFWNTREYILFRDNHQCQCCNGKTKDNILQIHHIVFKSRGGTDAPYNLITLCSTCHSHKNHEEGNVLWKWMIEKKKAGNFKDAAFMGIMRPELFKLLKEKYPNVKETFGYITKNTRIENELPKSHTTDAYCIANNIKAKRTENTWVIKKVRRHNRQIHKSKMLKGGKKKRNQAEYEVKGFRLFDKVLFEGVKCFIFARRMTGYFDVRTLDGTRIRENASYKKIKLLQRRSGYLLEERLLDCL